MAIGVGPAVGYEPPALRRAWSGLAVNSITAMNGTNSIRARHGLVTRNLGNHVYSIKSDGFANGTGDFSGAILMNDGTGWSGSDMIKYNVDNATCPKP